MQAKYGMRREQIVTGSLNHETSSFESYFPDQQDKQTGDIW